MHKRRSLAALGALTVAAALPRGAAAQEYPSRPIRLIVPWPAGGGTDNIARTLAEDLSPVLGQTIIVDNRGGANGIIGSDAVKQANADGYTLMFSDIFSHVMNAFLNKKLPYDIIKDFAPITQISTVPLLIVVNPAFPANNVADLVKLAKASPGTISYASFGTGSQAHIAGELFKLMGGIDMIHVPYKGGALALTDTLGGQIPVNFSGVNLSLQYIKSGRLRALALTGTSRSKFLPDVPTVSETPGFEGYEATVPFAVWAPAGTSADILARLNAAIVQVIRTDKFRQSVERKGSPGDTIGNTPAQMAQTVARYASQLPKVIAAAGIQPE